METTSDDHRSYEPPSIILLGSLSELTQQMFNKIGFGFDRFTLMGLPIKGSLIPVP